MGACQSCLGRRERDAYEEDEENRLLYDDAQGGHYGSFGDPQLAGDQDTLETQRESEALQRVVAKTSNNMVDIFEIAPGESGSKGTSTPFAYTGQGARVARYQHLLSKLNNNAEGSTKGIKVDWMEDEDADGPSHQTHSSRTSDRVNDPLVGTFADAAAAMK